MHMKLVVVGGVAGGASAAARVRRLDEKAEIKLFERGHDVSFSNCSLPYYLGGTVGSSEDLIMMTPEAFRAKHNIDVSVNSEVVAIDRAAKNVTVKNTLTGETFTESYDKLVLAPGASPIMPKSIRGIDRDNVFSVRNVSDVVRIKACLDRDGVRDVVVVGGGFIGIETAENLRLAGKNVAVVEGMGQILAPFDYDMVQTLQKELFDHDIRLCVGSTLTAIEDGRITATKDGKEFTLPADAVIMAIGVAPETGLARDAGLEIGQTRGIKVNEWMQTSDPDIYAVGDAVETFNAQTGLPGRLDTVINTVSVTEERQQKYDFTDPYLYIPRQVVVRSDNDTLKSWDDLKGAKVATSKASTTGEIYAEAGAEIVLIEGVDQAAQTVLSGRADFCNFDPTTLNDYLDEHPDAELKVAFMVPGLSEDYAIPILKGQTEFYEAVNQAVQELRSEGVLEQLSQQYLRGDYTNPVED